MIRKKITETIWKLSCTISEILIMEYQNQEQILVEDVINDSPCRIAFIYILSSDYGKNLIKLCVMGDLFYNQINS